MYVYQKSEPGLWTVGFYKPNGDWEPESDHDNEENAAERVAWLNGSYTVRFHNDTHVSAVSSEVLQLDDIRPDGSPPKIDF